jgi:glutaredoxin-related protein
VSSFGGISSGTPAAAPSVEVKPVITLNDRLKALVNQHKVMAFIKGTVISPRNLRGSAGTPSAPQCGYTRKFCGLLDENGIEFGSFNILADQEVREGLKKYSNWPTYPQVLYILNYTD